MPSTHRLAAAVLIGSSGTLVMLAMLWPYWRGDWPFLPAAAIGAGSMGYVFAGCFGHSGRRGIILGLFGALMTTVCGAAVAGFGLGLLLAATPAGLLIGPVAVGQALLTSPLALATWLASMAAAQFAMMLIRPGQLLPS